MRALMIVLALLLAPALSARAEVSVSLGINLGGFPELMPVPGYPVYYSPGIDGNYFFYDGLYWVFAEDRWYSSAWYDGPWRFVGPGYVPLFVLRIPVRYYRRPPTYFHGWRDDDAPRWGEHWGHRWEERRQGWDRWDRRAVPRPAPLPMYQREYAGDRYPRAIEQQHSIRSDNYRYRPHESASRQQFDAHQRADRPPGAQQRHEMNPGRPDASQRHESLEPRRAPAQRPQPSEQRQSQGNPERRPPEMQRNARPEPQRMEPQRQMRQVPPPAAREQRAAPPAREQGHPEPGHDNRDHERRPDHG